MLDKCHYPNGPRVTSLVVIRNQPRFLKLQKEWDRKGGGRKGGRKGGCREARQKMWQKKGGCSRDHWEGKSEIQRKEEKRRGDGMVQGRRVFLRVLRERVWVELQ